MSRSSNGGRPAVRVGPQLAPRPAGELDRHGDAVLLAQPAQQLALDRVRLGVVDRGHVRPALFEDLAQGVVGVELVGLVARAALLARAQVAHVDQRAQDPALASQREMDSEAAPMASARARRRPRRPPPGGGRRRPPTRWR
jgi:hypothetical protein